MKLLPPHQNKARKVTEEDLEFVYNEAAEMIKMCFKRLGRMGGAYAIHHAQVSETPLDFFVTKQGRIICNLEIVKHTKTTVDSEEFCYTFFYMENPAIVQRWNVIEVEYEELQMESLVEKREKITGKEARIWQHEYQHGQGSYVYEVNWDEIEMAKMNIVDEAGVVTDEQFDAMKQRVIAKEESKNNQSIEILK